MYINTYKEKIAIIIISHNSKNITNELCKKIISITKIPFDLCVIETGSIKEEISDYSTIWVKDGIRATRGFNIAINYMQQQAKCNDNEYKFWWCLMNDTILCDEFDVLNSLYNDMINNIDCGIIHPSINNSPSYILRKNSNNIRKESFVEFICPLIHNNLINKLFDNRFFYFWGVDYDMIKICFDNNMKIYIDDKIKIIHNAGTTTRNGKDNDFKTMEQQFNTSRQNMIEVMELKYGKHWYKVIREAIPLDVPCEAYVDWITKIGQNCKYEDLF